MDKFKTIQVSENAEEMDLQSGESIFSGEGSHLGWIQERTCTMEYQKSGYLSSWYKCSLCGGASDAITKGMTGPEFCGICGAKVIKEVSHE